MWFSTALNCGLLTLHLYLGLARTVYTYTVYDHMYGDFPALNTVCTPYIRINIWFWPTLPIPYRPCNLINSYHKNPTLLWPCHTLPIPSYIPIPIPSYILPNPKLSILALISQGIPCAPWNAHSQSLHLCIYGGVGVQADIHCSMQTHTQNHILAYMHAHTNAHGRAHAYRHTHQHTRTRTRIQTHTHTH